MDYRLRAAQPLHETVPAIAAEQLDAAIARLRSEGRNPEAIHAARRHFKRARALLDLVRPAADGKAVKVGRRLLASVARSLAASRDAQVIAHAAQVLEKEFGRPDRAALFSNLTSWLQARRELIDRRLDQANLEKALQNLDKAKARILKLNLRSATASDLLRSAAKTYRYGRQAMEIALSEGGDEALHEWRKQTQRHWRHMRLLEEAWPNPRKSPVPRARRLSDILGDHRDLTLLRETILANREVFPAADNVDILCRLIEKKQTALVKKAAAQGQRLYAKKPKAFLKHLEANWHSANRKEPQKASQQA